jgi:hypothetical protein
MSAEGSDPVLLNYLAFAWSFGFLGKSERKEKKLDSYGRPPSPGLLLGGKGVGSSYRIIFLCYYEPLPYHVQATKDANVCAVILFSPCSASSHFPFLNLLVVLELSSIHSFASYASLF